ncbi:MAG: hypothetical protein ACFBZ9_14175 [Sphingomonadales bacterium]
MTGHSQGEEEGLLTQADFAKTHDVTRAMVTNWKKQGQLVIRNGMVDVEASDAALQDAKLGRFNKSSWPDSDQRQQSEEALPSYADLPTVNQSERLKAAALADIRQMDAAERRGTLVNRALAHDFAAEIAIGIKQQLEGFPARHADIIAEKLKSDPRLTAATLTEHVRLELAEIADSIADRLAAGIAGAEPSTPDHFGGDGRGAAAT